VAMTEPASMGALVLMHSGDVFAPGWIDAPESQQAELPAFGGIANARALAGMYKQLAGGGGGPGRAEPLSVVGGGCSAACGGATRLVPTRWSSGFVKSVDNSALGPGDRDGVVLSDAAFGHVGMGGSLGFVDPAVRLSFGYTMNRQGLSVGLDARG